MTATNKQTLEQYLTPGTRVHLIGIGGVSMRPLGLVLRHMGLKITGSDMNASVIDGRSHRKRHPRFHRPPGGEYPRGPVHYPHSGGA